MPSKPIAASLTKEQTSPKASAVLQAIRDMASDSYRENIPIATNTASLNKIGAILEKNRELSDEFQSLLWGRVARVIIQNRLFRNPLEMLKKGEMQLGEAIEEVFVAPAVGEVFDDDGVPDESTLRRVKSEIYSAFHVMNYEVQYQCTIQNIEYRKYFLSWSGIDDLIRKITETLYAGAYLDEFNVMKYMIGRAILSGRIASYNVGDYNTDPTEATVGLKSVSNLFEFSSREYNAYGVPTYSNKSDQFFIVNAAYDARQSVEVQAAAFNLEKVEFLGHRLMIDSFSNVDFARIGRLFRHDPDFKPFTQDEKDILDKVMGVLMDREWFQIYDNLNEFSEQYNAKKLFWNYFLTVFRTLGESPFANCLAFVNGVGTVTGITVTPKTANLVPRQGVKLDALVTGSGLYSKGVTWTSSNPNVIVNVFGYVYANQDASGTATITAASAQDSNFTDTATITIA